MTKFGQLRFGRDAALSDGRPVQRDSPRERPTFAHSRPLSRHVTRLAPLLAAIRQRSPLWPASRG